MHRLTSTRKGHLCRRFDSCLGVQGIPVAQLVEQSISAVRFLSVFYK